MKVNEPESFVMTGLIENRPVDMDGNRDLGTAELYRLASKITCKVNVMQTEHFKMELDKSKPIEFRLFRGVYNSSLALPTDQEALPKPLKRTLTKQITQPPLTSGGTGSTVDKQVDTGEYLPIKYSAKNPDDTRTTVQQALYTYLWTKDDVPQLYIKVWLKESKSATESTPYYYRLPIEEPQNNQFDAGTYGPWKITRNTWYDVTLNISTKGELSDKDPIDVEGTFIVSDWIKDRKYYNYRIYGYKYLYLPQKEVVVMNSYLPSSTGFDRDINAKADKRSIPFETTLPDVECVVESVCGVTVEKAYSGLGNTRKEIHLSDADKRNIFNIENNQLNVTLPFPGFFEYERDYYLTLRSKTYPDFQEKLVIRHIPSYAVAQSDLVGVQSNLRGLGYNIHIANSGTNQNVNINAGTYSLVRFGGGQKPDDDMRQECIKFGLRKDGKQMTIFRVLRAPEGAVLGYPPMDEDKFYRFAPVREVPNFNDNPPVSKPGQTVDDMQAVRAYDPGGGKKGDTPNSYKCLDNEFVVQSFTRMDKATEKMISPKFIVASDLGAVHPIRYYSAFKNDGLLAKPMDREGMYHDNNANYTRYGVDIPNVYKLDMGNNLYKNNAIYKPKDAKYAYVNTHLLETNILTRLSQYWEVKGDSLGTFYNDANYRNNAGASGQALIGIDALNLCAQYWEDVKLKDGTYKRIKNWRVATKAEMELIAAIQLNQRETALPKGDREHLLKYYKDNNIFIWLIVRSYFHNNGYMIFEPNITNEQFANSGFNANKWSISYDFAYPGDNFDWLGYYALFVRCVHDIDRYEDESYLTKGSSKR